MAPPLTSHQPELDPLEELLAIDSEPCCRVCGCTPFDPCAIDGGGYCFLIDPDLCSRCALTLRANGDPDT